MRQDSPPLRFLAAEAERLKHLYSYYAADREFLAGREGSRIVYFCDAHDLKAYLLTQTDQDSLDGFRTDAERVPRRRTPVTT